MDVLSGVVAAIYRNGTQIVVEPIAVLDMLYDCLAWNDWHGWHEYAEQANASANTFVEDVAASAENKTLYYIGNCAGDVITVYALLKSAGEASAASQNHKAQSRTSLIIGNARTTNGMHFAIAFEVEGDVTLAAEVSAVGALALPPGDFDGNAMFGGTDDFENLWNSLFIKTGVTGSSGTGKDMASPGSVRPEAAVLCSKKHGIN